MKQMMLSELLLAKRKKEGYTTFMVTPDKDFAIGGY
jgi:hypothetical protein